MGGPYLPSWMRKRTAMERIAKALAEYGIISEIYEDNNDREK